MSEEKVENAKKSEQLMVSLRGYLTDNTGIAAIAVESVYKSQFRGSSGTVHALIAASSSEKG